MVDMVYRLIIPNPKMIADTTSIDRSDLINKISATITP